MEEMPTPYQTCDKSAETNTCIEKIHWEAGLKTENEKGVSWSEEREEVSDKVSGPLCLSGTKVL